MPLSRLTCVGVAQDALEDAARKRNEFLSMLAHELRNPLAAISNAVHLLERAARAKILNGPKKSSAGR